MENQKAKDIEICTIVIIPSPLFPETNDDHPSEDSEADSHKAADTQSDEAGRKWPESRKSGCTNMADRPLPVPVENESYYMNVDRGEAQNLLRGQPDGTFILRPSSQVGLIIDFRSL